MTTGLFFIPVSYVFSMVGDAFGYPTLLLVGSCLFLFSFATSLGGIFYIYQVELLPSKVLAPVSISQWVFTVLISYFTLPLIKTVGIYSLYMVFFVCGVFTWFIFTGLAVESKDRESSEILSEFDKKVFLK